MNSLLRCGQRRLYYLTFSLVILLASCSEDPASSTPAFTVLPQLQEQDKHTRIPLATSIKFTANKPVQALYTIRAGNRTWQVSNLSFALEHHQPLVNFIAGQQHEILVTLTDKEGRKTSSESPLLFKPSQGDLPKFESFHNLYNDFTLVSLFRYTQSNHSDLTPDPFYGLLLALNKSGEVVWSYQTDYVIEAIEPQSAYAVTIVSPAGRETIDYLGSRQVFWHGDRQKLLPASDENAVMLNASYLHHKGALLADGNQLILSAEARVVDNYPAFPVNSNAPKIPELVAGVSGALGKTLKQAWVVEDNILNVSATGEVLSRWNLLDVLDPKRQTYQSSLLTYKKIFPPFGNLPDPITWSAANSLVYNKETNTVIVSLRHQEAIVGLDKTSGSIKWILGDPQGWQSPWLEKVLKPISASGSEKGTWPYSPSSLTLASSGELLFIDNGGYRAIPPHKPGKLSDAMPRVMGISIDEKAMTYEINTSVALDQEEALIESQHWLRQQAISLSTTDDYILAADGLPGKIWEINPKTNSRKLLVSLNQQDGPLHWGIKTIAQVNNLQPPLEFKVSQKRVPESVNQSHDLNDSKGKRNPVTLKPDLSVPHINIEGQWQMTVGEGVDATDVKLVLEQKGQVVTGNLATLPLTGFIKGNTFSTTIRTQGDKGKVRFRYRGVINPDGNTIEGSVTAEMEDGRSTSTTWTANKL